MELRITTQEQWRRRRRYSVTIIFKILLCIYILPSSSVRAFFSNNVYSPRHSSSFISSRHTAAVLINYSSTSNLNLWNNNCNTIQTQHLTNSEITMGKGDGKKKRKKKTTTTDTTTTSSTSSTNSPTLSNTPQTITPPPPQRVTNDINIPIRHQIMWAKRKKAARTANTAFRQSNRHRVAYRKTLGEEELELAKIERTRKGQEPDWEVILNTTATSPLVIVDAYNIIYKWPRLKKWMVKGMLSKARELLIHDLEELHYIKGWRIEIVFDGFGRNTNGPLGDGPGTAKQRAKISKLDQQASKTVTDHGVRVVYSGAGTSADGYIEKRCFEAKSVTGGTLTGSLIVATDDNMVKTAASNSGALCMSAGRMVDELKVVRKATKFRVEAAVAAVNANNAAPQSVTSEIDGDASMTSGIDGAKIIVNTYGRGTVVIKDNRSRVKKKRAAGQGSKTLEDLKKGTTEIPDWAMTPEMKKQMMAEEVTEEEDNSSSTLPDS